jgi:LPXTG-motif cell wall-anchored protein
MEGDPGMGTFQIVGIVVVIALVGFLMWYRKKQQS